MSKLDQKLITVYKSIDYIEKAGKNSQQNYKYVRAADVVRAVRAALADNGIYAEINMEFHGEPYTIARSKDPLAPFSAVNVKCSVVLHDIESDETRTASGLGTGADLGDKAVYKAETGALKYALRNALLIPDEAGADPEADESVDRAADSSATREPDVELEPVTKLPASKIPPFSYEAAANALAAVAVRGASHISHQREPGDESEPGGAMPADDGMLPTEDEINQFRDRFNKIVDNLSSSKALSASKGLKVEKKLVVFLLQTVGAARTGDVTRAQWLDFLGRVDDMGAKENGWTVLGKKINKANGIETN